MPCKDGPCPSPWLGPRFPHLTKGRRLVDKGANLCVFILETREGEQAKGLAPYRGLGTAGLQKEVASGQFMSSGEGLPWVAAGLVPQFTLGSSGSVVRRWGGPSTLTWSRLPVDLKNPCILLHAAFWALAM